MKKIFVSYSRADGGDLADHLRLHYESEGYQTFVDYENIKLGEDWSDRIKNSISDSDVVAVIVTRSALRSLEVEKEVEEARRQNKIIIPCVYKGILWVSLKWDLNKLQGFVFDNKNSLVRQLDEMIFESKSIIKNPVKTQTEAFKIIIHKKSTKILIVSISVILAITLIIGLMTQYFSQPASQPNTSGIDTPVPPQLKTETKPQQQDLNEIFSNGQAFYTGKDYPNAVDSFNKFLQFEPNNASALFLKGSSQYQSQNYSGAVDSFNEYLRIDPNNMQILLDNGRAYYEIFDYLDAINQFDKVLVQDPTNKEALFYKGLSLSNLDRNNEAIAQFNIVLAQDPTNKEALFYKGLSLYELNRYDEALAIYDQLLQLDPDNINATLEKERVLQAKANQSSSGRNL